jgi:alpha-1,3-mannosyl-glycoprotein beta-1,2-N-acetylglucosaminyltransferase
MGFFAVYEYYRGDTQHYRDLIRAEANVIRQKLHHAHVQQPGASFDSPLLIFTCNRPQYLTETLDHIYDSLKDCTLVGCPIIISEDGDHDNIEAVVQTYHSKFALRGVPVIHIHHPQITAPHSGHLRQPDPNFAYKALAQHYGWALGQVFDGNVFHPHDGSSEQFLPQRVIILEEDIKVAPDFFSYMAATAPLLDHDPTLYAVSAFNDNGHLVKDDSTRLLRSDFFPGLGWMMTRSLWMNEFQTKWPSGFWDDWIRDPQQRKKRQVIRPEVSRTYHFGRKGGASANQFGSILEMVKLNQHNIDWQSQNLSYLQSHLYEEQYLAMVNESRLASTLEEAQGLLQKGSSNVRLEYIDYKGFKALAKRLRIMDDEKAMVPRTAYKGIVEVRPHGDGILFLTPQSGNPFY